VNQGSILQISNKLEMPIYSVLSAFGGLRWCIKKQGQSNTSQILCSAESAWKTLCKAWLSSAIEAPLL
jgi:hypothetical protein